MDNKLVPEIKFSSESLFALMVLLIPLSIKIFLPIIGTVLIYPGELFIAILALIFSYNIILKRGYKEFDKKFITHPITLSIFAYLFVNFISTAFSSMHLVSLKALTVKTAYIVVFYFFIYSITKKSRDSFIELFKLYGFSLCLVIVYSLFNQYKLGFTRGGAGFACHP